MPALYILCSVVFNVLKFVLDGKGDSCIEVKDCSGKFVSVEVSLRAGSNVKLDA
jgi:hypothetical protein